MVCGGVRRSGLRWSVALFVGGGYLVSACFEVLCGSPKRLRFREE